MGFVKLNVDVAYDINTQRTGFGAVLRDDGGCLKGAMLEAIHG